MGLNDDANLELLLKLDETTGTVPIDSSPKARTISMNQLDFATDSVTGKFNNALFRKDSGDRIDCGVLALPDADQSVALWVKYSSSWSGSSYFISSRSDSTGGFSVQAFGTTLLRFYIGNTNNGSIPVLNINDGFWHHLGFVYTQSSGDILCYQNGTLAGTELGPVSGVWGVADNTLFGGERINSSFSGNITMDDIRIYSRTLSAAEMLTLATDPYLSTGISKRLSKYIPPKSVEVY